MELRLLIGNKNYSSWSLRPWLLMKQKQIPFVEEKLSLYSEPGKIKLRERSPTAKVPVLEADGLQIWDSLAIAEFLHESFPEQSLWPRDNKARAMARSVSNEMHSSFGEVRNLLPMNCRRQAKFNRITPALQGEIDRIIYIWEQCLTINGSQDGFLFEEFSIADAMFAPVVSRFHTYQIATSEIATSYMERMLSLQSFKEWMHDATNEEEFVEQYEIEVD